MPKAGKYKWLSSLRVLVYNASVVYFDLYFKQNMNANRHGRIQ